MTDLLHTNRYRLPLLLLAILLTVAGLATLWEFELEAYAMRWLGLTYDGDFEDGERLRFILTSSSFSLIAMIVPSVVLKRMVSNTQKTHRRLLRLQIQTEHLANNDSLTGLTNRRVFMDVLRDQLARHKPLAIMLIDLDHFKAINDEHGHSAGDATLIEVARRLQGIANQHEGMAVRLGGDEFCLLLMGKKDQSELTQIAQMTIALLGAPMPEVSNPAQLGATVGVARSWKDSQDPSMLLHYADAAMYRGKHSDRSTFNFYDSAYEQSRLAQQDFEAALIMAVEKEEIVPFYQPIVALPSQTLVGYEILARWIKADGTTGMPADFIAQLERLGLIPAMTRSLVKQACQAASAWDDSLHLSLNVSAAMITDESFPDRLLDQLRQEKFPFERFEVEITEEALVGNLEAAQLNLSKLHAYGIVVALDDFGIGYSGLYHLTRLSIDKIKIDRSFFEAGKLEHLPMVEAILGMAQSLKMKVTAEGIEDFHLPHLPEWLAQNGCHYAQGYLYGRPQSANDIAVLRHGVPCLTGIGAPEAWAS
ncbi:putative bifunctional diguanylate cyclase/phosphodiesterase [Pseudomonas syringae]|uniref:putative bifunctional diguanylate cyclase/phosphodiesterase n=1 Tax=Pseudomonas syringae TaxID=317 RepID=UPI001F450B31|nr:EAL domain-containing protein [Pseudomonas syringae]MCF5244245.1 EAL domain-containing protein [Pseudomonas syringae]